MDQSNRLFTISNKFYWNCLKGISVSLTAEVGIVRTLLLSLYVCAMYFFCKTWLCNSTLKTEIKTSDFNLHYSDFIRVL